MSRLAPFGGSDAAWDRLVDALGATSPYTYSGWARFKADDGWTPLRLTDPAGRCAVQLLVKRAVPGVVVGWAPGSPLGDVSACTTADVLAHLRAARRAVVHYVRLGATYSSRDADEQALRDGGWSTVDTPLSSGRSLIVSLQHDEATRLAACSSNWSRNLKRGRSRDNVVSVWTSPDPRSVAALHDELQNFKGAHVVDWRSQPERIAALIREFGDRLVVVQCRDVNGDLHAVRGAIICSGSAFDIIAATSIEGRRRYSSHVALWELMNELARRGIREFDMGGVDPVRNKGVYDFKHGVGAHDVHYLGERDAATPAILRSVLGRIVASRVA